jgi:hypothetical protein
MTDGERLIWATTFAIVLDRDGDAGDAVRAAARAVGQLRAVVELPVRTIWEPHEQHFFDEMVNVP